MPTEFKAEMLRRPREENKLPGPFSVGISSNNRPEKKRDDISEVPNKINTQLFATTDNLPFGDRSMSHVSSDISARTPTLIPRVSNDELADMDFGLNANPHNRSKLLQ